MAIERNAGSSGGNFVRDPGEYRVKVHETKTGLSKSGKPMLTVVFHTADEKSINAYFVKALAFHMKALDFLKIACGLKVSDLAENLVGKECGILVEAQEPTQEGRVFMQITGYGKAAFVAPDIFSQGRQPGEDEVPF